MIQPAACVLPSNAPPLREGGGDNTIQHASRVLQEHSVNRQQNDHSSTAVYEPTYNIPTQTGENAYPSFPQFPQHQPQTDYSQTYRAPPGYGYRHPDNERGVVKKASELYRRFQECPGYTKYRSRQQKDDKAGQEQKWPDHLEEAFFRGQYSRQTPCERPC